MDQLTNNVFAPVQAYLEVTKFTNITYENPLAVTVIGENNVFFGPRYNLGTGERGFKNFNSTDNTYIGVTSTNNYTAFTLPTDAFNQNYHVKSVMIGNDYQLPPAGNRNTLIANDLTWQFEEAESGNVLIAPFTQATYLGTVPQPIKTSSPAANWVVIGFPDPARMRSNGVLINCAKFDASAKTVTNTNRVQLNLKSVTFSQETSSTLQKLGIPVNGLYFNSDRNVLRIRLK